MPSSGPFSEAVRYASFTCSFVTSRPSLTTRSVIDPVGTGARTEMPSTFPCRSGMTSPIARAAPVEVAPGEVRRIALGKDLQLGLAGLDRGIADLDVLVQLPENGVVLEQVPHRLRVAEVVDRDELEVAAALEMRTEEIAPDPPESVDPHARLRHQGRV